MNFAQLAYPSLPAVMMYSPVSPLPSSPNSEEPVVYRCPEEHKRAETSSPQATLSIQEREREKEVEEIMFRNERLKTCNKTKLQLHPPKQSLT
jgi:hypothetical protein